MRNFGFNKGLVPRRSALYVPGNRLDLLDKALTSKADVIILDLEDAVAPDQKTFARNTVVQWLRKTSSNRKEILVRVNALGTEWGLADLRAFSEIEIDGVLFPKISTVEDALTAQELVKKTLQGKVAVWFMIETPLSILNIASIGQIAALPDNRIEGWIMGTNDLVKDLRAAHVMSRDPVFYALSVALLAARSHGIAILDGVHNDFRDVNGLEFAARQAAEMGYDGKTVIHPAQIESCRLIFSPDQRAVANAELIVAEFDRPENQSKGVLQIKGRMVERLHVDSARTLLAQVRAIEDLEGESYMLAGVKS